ncbi:MAG: hypothetical protein ABUL48_02610, partial [Pseudorhodoplanes sp.]
RLLDEHVGKGRTKVLDVFFMAPVFPEDRLTLTAEVVEVAGVVRCTLAAHNADGVQTARGVAELAR